MDNAKLNEFVGKALADLGGAFSVPLVRIGDRLGLYKALHAAAARSRGELPRRHLPSDTQANGSRSRLPPPTFHMMRRQPGSRYRLSTRWSSPWRTARSICKARSTLRR